MIKTGDPPLLPLILGEGRGSGFGGTSFKHGGRMDRTLLLHFFLIRNLKDEPFLLF